MGEVGTPWQHTNLCAVWHVCVQVRLKNAHARKLPAPDSLQVDDLDWLKVCVVGNQVDNTLHMADYNTLSGHTRKLYKQVDRNDLPNKVMIPQYNNKEDEHDMKIWCVTRYKNGLTSSNWLRLGREFTKVIDPPLTYFKPIVLAMRGACCRPNTFAMLSAASHVANAFLISVFVWQRFRL